MLIYDKKGLFQTTDRNFRFGSEPFFISDETLTKIEQIGPILLNFYEAVNELYDLSIRGSYPAWIHQYLNGGKTERVIDYGRMRRFKQDLPMIIRPDIILTDDGFIISELDSVPGGFGLLAALSEYYANAGFNLVGGNDGIVANFAKAIRSQTEKDDPTLAIVVSRESEDYRGEMEFMATALTDYGLRTYTISPEDIVFQEDGLYHEQEDELLKIDIVYRFFELFDLKNIPKIDLLLYAVRKQVVIITPPLKSYLEEKLLFALFHHPMLEEYWLRSLGKVNYELLHPHIPQTWIMDNRPLPPHGVIPNLKLGDQPVTDWHQLKQATKRQRQLVIKISGFSELAWGSHSVCIGHDVSADQWGETIDHALASFPDHPYILQEFHKGRRVKTSYLTSNSQETRVMQGRARLCPYYFVNSNQVNLAGILATICPLDKKIIHGMADAVMVPTSLNRGDNSV